jgi:hypothetical protein
MMGVLGIFSPGVAIVSEDLTFLLLSVGGGIIGGLFLGVFLRRNRQLRDRISSKIPAIPWWFYLAGAIMFICFAVAQFVEDRFWFGTFFTAFAGLDVAVLAMNLLRKPGIPPNPSFPIAK